MSAPMRQTPEPASPRPPVRENFWHRHPRLRRTGQSVVLALTLSGMGYAADRYVTSRSRTPTPRSTQSPETPTEAASQPAAPDVMSLTGIERVNVWLNPQDHVAPPAAPQKGANESTQTYYAQLQAYYAKHAGQIEYQQLTANADPTLLSVNNAPEHIYQGGNYKELGLPGIILDKGMLPNGQDYFVQGFTRVDSKGNEVHYAVLFKLGSTDAGSVVLEPASYWYDGDNPTHSNAGTVIDQLRIGEVVMTGDMDFNNPQQVLGTDGKYHTEDLQTYQLAQWIKAIRNGENTPPPSFVMQAPTGAETSTSLRASLMTIS